MTGGEDVLTNAFVDCDGSAPDAGWLMRLVAGRHPVSGVRTGQSRSSRSGTYQTRTYTKQKLPQTKFVQVDVFKMTSQKSQNDWEIVCLHINITWPGYSDLKVSVWSDVSGKVDSLAAVIGGPVGPLTALISAIVASCMAADFLDRGGLEENLSNVVWWQMVMGSWDWQQMVVICVRGILVDHY